MRGPNSARRPTCEYSPINWIGNAPNARSETIQNKTILTGQRQRNTRSQTRDDKFKYVISTIYDQSKL